MADAQDLKPFDKRWLERRGNFYALITPEVAAELLTRNTNNRRTKPRKIAAFSRDMAAGKWSQDASDIKFDREGALLDGQNRLLSCIEADAPFPTLVRTGLDPAARDHVDTGAARTTGDAFRMHQVLDANVMAAAVSLRRRYEALLASDASIARSYQIAPPPTHHESLAYLAEHPMLEKMANAGRALHQMAPGITRSVWVAFTSMIGEADEDAGRRFSSMLLTGDTDVTGAQLALMRYLASAQSPKMLGNRDRNSAGRHLLACIKAWNAWRSDEKIERIAIREDDKAVPVK